jgi:hypothetical protein
MDAPGDGMTIIVHQFRECCNHPAAQTEYDINFIGEITSPGSSS